MMGPGFWAQTPPPKFYYIEMWCPKVGVTHLNHLFLFLNYRCLCPTTWGSDFMDPSFHWGMEISKAPQQNLRTTVLVDSTSYHLGTNQNKSRFQRPALLNHRDCLPVPSEILFSRLHTVQSRSSVTGTATPESWIMVPTNAPVWGQAAV